jgi:hypothetical protein
MEMKKNERNISKKAFYPISRLGKVGIGRGSREPNQNAQNYK